MSTPAIAGNRLYALDVLRGVAALSVVFWHWQHFFYKGDTPYSFHPESQPLFGLFSFFYLHGALAVELFFCISGFVFFWLYSEKISNSAIKPLAFFVDRFSRLYPLHIATFLAVSLLQNAYIRQHDTFFVYPFNDLYHAVLNIFLIPAWGFEKGWSFNAPVWSVSVEVMLYFMFFLVAMTRYARYLLIPGLIMLGSIIDPANYKFGNGMITFFCGGAAYLIFEIASNRIDLKILTYCMAALAVSAWLYLFLCGSFNLYFVMGVLFPLSVAAVAAAGFLHPYLLKPLSGLGDISYSSYLLHFPLQICFAMAVDHAEWSRDVFYSPWMLALFMSLLILLSFISHRFFEIPVQRAIRSTFKSHKQATRCT
ncbi:acyltransferase family protein [Pseudomonas syringae]|uniref:acyltransferase family protein n=1 Tax=Pseudomonas syringae TaxID=317 RepID=UPI003F74D60F